MNKLYRPSKLIASSIFKRNSSLRIITLNNNNHKIYSNNNSIKNNINNSSNNRLNRFYTTTTATATSTSNSNTSQNIENAKLEQEDNNSKYNITLSDNCVKELNKIQSQNKDSYLRVMVDMGGCSGYQYIIKMEDKMQEDDVLFTKDGAKVIIDKISLEMMVGSVIDYETNLMRSSFCVASNPNTIKSCGCKISFDLKK